MTTVYLQGSEAVAGAAERMRSAADSMEQSVRNMDGSFDRFRYFMDDWLERFREIVDKSKGDKAG